MSTVEPDASELLVKALDLAVGASALARYAFRHTEDAKLRRLFRQFASTSEHQEQLLREQLTHRGLGAPQPLGRELVMYVVLGLASTAAVLGAVSLALYQRTQRRDGKRAVNLLERPNGALSRALAAVRWPGLAPVSTDRKPALRAAAR
ncbi:MAG: hypothetical protein M3442_14585 [Chloroflexota bacterium]|nr:hypothetical protein [Chloroflexota bacterium]